MQAGPPGANTPSFPAQKNSFIHISCMIHTPCIIHIACIIHITCVVHIACMIDITGIIHIACMTGIVEACLILVLLNLYSSGSPTSLVNGQCVKYSSSRRILHHHKHFGASNTIEHCLDYCRAQGFQFMGVVHSEHCFCGNTAPLQTDFAPSTECNKKCRGNQKQICGGSWRMNVYIVLGNTAGLNT